jgi:hypothetical protein
MKVTRELAAAKLADYLHHDLSLQDLVCWAEGALMDGEMPADDPALRDVVARLGLADVRAFGLGWEDCEDFLSRLGYRAKVEIVAA